MSQELPRDADVVVVGTGAFGLSVTTQLARLGVRRVVALDRFEIASQTSPRAAGLLSWCKLTSSGHVWRGWRWIRCGVSKSSSVCQFRSSILEA